MKTRYKDPVHLLLLLLALAVVWTLVSTWMGLEPRVRRQLTRWLVGALLLGALLVVLVRFGHWFALTAALVLGLVRKVGPLLASLLPVLLRARTNPAADGPSRSAGAAGDSGKGSAPREPHAGRPERMTRAQALAVLGLEEGATREQIVAAYRSLIARVHPDRPGGSNYLASQINEAKRVLIP